MPFFSENCNITYCLDYKATSVLEKKNCIVSTPAGASLATKNKSITKKDPFSPCVCTVPQMIPGPQMSSTNQTAMNPEAGMICYIIKDKKKKTE